MYRIITNPTATVVFYTRTIIEALTTGALTEKEIRTATLDICKDLGIKSTCRGTIAGLNLDVPAICNVLASYGILELDTSSTSTINIRNSLSDYRKRVMDQCKDQVSAAQSDAFLIDPATVLANSNIDIVEGELKALTSVADVVERKTYMGDDIFRMISVRWQEKLAKYLLDSQCTNIQALQNAAIATAAAKVAASQETLMNSGFDTTSFSNGTSASLVPFSSSSSSTTALNGGFNFTNSYNHHNQHHMINYFGQSASSADYVRDSNNNNYTTHSNLIPSQNPNTLWSTKIAESFPNGTTNFLTTSYSNSSSSSSSSSHYNHVNGNINISGNVNKSSSTTIGNNVTINNPVDNNNITIESTAAGSESTSKVLKRASNQRAWKLAVDISHLRHPEKLLTDWSDACYAEAAALETEEAVLRRLIGQCELGIDNKPRRNSTSYLTQASSSIESNVIGGFSGVDLTGPRTLRLGAELTGDQLWEKARAAFVRRKLHGKGSSRQALGSSSSSSSSDAAVTTYGVAFPMPHPSAIGEDGAGFLTQAGANKYVKKIPTAVGAGETRAQHGLASFRAAQQRSYVPPVVLQNDNVYWESVTQKGSIFASQFPAPPSSFPATVIRPDLTLFTTAVPWSAMAREFVTLDYEDLHHDSAVTSAQPSQPNSARGISHTPKYGGGSSSYESSSSHVYNQKTDGLPSSQSPSKLQSASSGGDKSARKLPLSVSMNNISGVLQPIPVSNSKPSQVIAPTFTEIEPINVRCSFIKLLLFIIYY